MKHLVEEEQHERDGVSKNNNGDTPLMLAAAEGHETVVYCIASRFSRCIDWRNKVGATAMMHAAKNGCDAVVNVTNITTLKVHGNKKLIGQYRCY